MPPSFSRHSNSAGSALPRIPRRSPSVSNSRFSFTKAIPDSPPSPPKPTVLVVQPPTPPHAAAMTTPRPPCTASASGSSSSSDSSMQFFVTRQRRSRMGSKMRSPEESTPTPAVLRARSSSPSEQVAFPTHVGPLSPETPRPSSSGGIPHAPATAPLPEFPTAVRVEPPSRAVSVSVPSNVSAQLTRKKSGEPLKSSLKSRRAVVRGDLSVVTGGGAEAEASLSKSEPTTPVHSSKSVHFDSQLEHVKLFLAEQKPLAVSRDGSPTTDTSGTDSDFPAFIYGEDEKRIGEKKGRLAMEVMNMPAKDTPQRKAAECALEELTLGADSAAVQGRVRVKNIAFQKWVAVRFTFDWWQTTSEVTARYVHTLEGGLFDVFAFTIRLNDMLARIEEKTLFMAIRYTVDGKEIWDNNGGENFQVKFSRHLEAPQPSPARPATERKNISDLRIKLEKVASTQSPARKSPSPRADTFNLRSSTPLSARYDLSASFKRPWKSPSPTAHTRTSTYPSATSPNAYHTPGYARNRPRFSPRTLGRPRVVEDSTPLTRGSPRILDPDDDAPPIPKVALYSGSDEEDGESATPMPFSRVRGRNHQRGYFDLSPSTPGFGARKALPAAFREEAVPRFGSVDTYRTPAVCVGIGMGAGLLGPWPITRGGSEESTPSVTSQSEESSASSSPSGSPPEEGLFGYLARQERVQSPANDPSYNVFLNKFCFYTGSDSLLDVQPEVIQRSHSASSVEELLSSPTSNYHLSPGNTPTRSPSFDDVAYMSGASTPIARSIVDSQTPTPISLAS
ncbi:putative phosphatase regulatory subunit-domain-containing protein [Fomitopsis serialis]|uniref:putative phosphatase regulatory subunit-domain-containing protein n=1 Tax=Fomitopsis serialis TaxID=139415 RepID=UPI002008D5FE|nr:putative phosphatase regulatory subunit-domain-containing protein [Neoantrodia serialis]KAH9914470.1 putative phosphatase regulatory subunit-domain-containing protein [Neoantrodia serialis]